MRPFFYFIVVIGLLVGCTPELPNPANITPVTAIPTETGATLCALGQDEAQAWEARIDALETLYTRNGSCEFPLNALLYIAYVDYGRELEANDDVENAIEAYQRALVYFADGTQAQARLDRLQSAEATEVVALCESETAANDYQSTDMPFVTIENNQLTVDGAPYSVYGVTYYPSTTPFDLFLTETDLDDVRFELDLIASVGINTLRIFLKLDDMFLCDAPVPDANVVERLDSLINIASENDLRLIFVLTDNISPDVLYFDAHIPQQIEWIVEHYRNEGAILAWDVRDRGDTDYREGFIRRDIAMRWYADTILMIRTTAPQHLITIGFEQDALITAPLVDFVSFQFYGDYENLRQEIANLRASASRPILLAGIGYSTFTVSDVTQRNLLFQAFEEVENNSLAGWVVNHAFDYPRTATCIPPDCPGSGSDINQFGLWNTGYFPKLAIEAVRLATGFEEE